MMRHFLFILAWIFSSFAFAQEAKQIANRKIQAVYSHVENHQKDKDEQFFTTSYYDRKGREVESYIFNKDSICISAEFFEYNKKGRLTSHTTIDSLAHSHSVLTQNYDRWNRLAEKVLMVDGKQKERTAYIYNNLDDRTSEIIYDEKNALKKETSFFYDQRGMLIQKTIKDGNGNIIYNKVNRYDY